MGGAGSRAASEARLEDARRRVMVRVRACERERARASAELQRTAKELEDTARMNVLPLTESAATLLAGAEQRVHDLALQHVQLQLLLGHLRTMHDVQNRVETMELLDELQRDLGAGSTEALTQLVRKAELTMMRLEVADESTAEALGATATTRLASRAQEHVRMIQDQQRLRVQDQLAEAEAATSPAAPATTAAVAVDDPTDP